MHNFICAVHYQKRTWNQNPELVEIMKNTHTHEQNEKTSTENMASLYNRMWLCRTDDVYGLGGFADIHERL